MLYPTQVIKELRAQLAASQRAYTELHTKHEDLQAQLKELKK